MPSELTGRIFDIQSFAVQDGPGIRTTVFFKGCPLRCPWCHSPESQAFHPQLCWMSQKCLGAEHCKDRCMLACPKSGISYGDVTQNSVTGEDIQLVRVNRTLCDNCGTCASKCYQGALYICGEDYTVEQVMQIVRRDVSFYAESGGGVTLSGGECMCQPEFALELLKAMKAENIHTAVDTTGFVPWEKLEAVLPYTDLFLYDLKHMNSRDHELVTGVPNELILDNARRIAAAGGEIQVRIPVIPSFNNSPENMEQTGRFICELGDAVSMVQLLPYHNMGSVKYFRLNEEERVMEAVPPSDEEMQGHKALLESMGLNVSIH